MSADVKPAGGAPIDSANYFEVVLRADGTIGIFKWQVESLSKSDAINLAAWIVAMADDLPQFARVLHQIKSHP